MINWGLVKKQAEAEITRLFRSETRDEHAKAEVLQRCVRLAEEAYQASERVTRWLKRLARMRSAVAGLLASLQDSGIPGARLKGRVSSSNGGPRRQGDS